MTCCYSAITEPVGTIHLVAVGAGVARVPDTAAVDVEVSLSAVHTQAKVVKWQTDTIIVLSCSTGAIPQDSLAASHSLVVML